MKPVVTNIRKLFKSARYSIPRYQREYQWGPEQWQGLWYDVGQLYKRTDEGPAHFTGILLVDPEPEGAGQMVNSVIDGQQRLITFLVMQAAIRDAAGGHVVAKGARDDLFFAYDADGELTGRRLSAQAVDEEQLEAVRLGTWEEWYRSIKSERAFGEQRILWAYTYFRLCLWLGEASFQEENVTLPRFKAAQRDMTAEQMWAASPDLLRHRANAIRLSHLKQQFGQMSVLELLIDADDEDAPTIFQSINAQRTQLQQWDFIRNLIFTRFDAKQRSRVFDEHWYDVQEMLGTIKWDNKRSTGRDGFIYDYLIARGEQQHQGSIGRNRGFQHLRARMARELPRPEDPRYDAMLEQFVTGDLLTAAHVWPVAVGAQDTPMNSKRAISTECAQLIESIGKISAGPPFPLVLHYLERWHRQEMDGRELERSLRLIENFLVRLVVCNRPLSPLRAVFMSGMPAIIKDPSLTGLQAWLAEPVDSELPRFPTDEEVKLHLKERDYFGSGVSGSQLGAIFRGIERVLSGKASNPLPYGTDDADFTVEHIYPQSCVPKPNATWTRDLDAWGADRGAMALRLHRLGNLTLLTFAANRYIKARSFKAKCDVLMNEDPKSEHPILGVNQSIFKNDFWGPDQIDTRTDVLIEAFLKRWPGFD